MTHIDSIISEMGWHRTQKNPSIIMRDIAGVGIVCYHLDKDEWWVMGYSPSFVTDREREKYVNAIRNRIRTGV